jgi:hypothetical protein
VPGPTVVPDHFKDPRSPNPSISPFPGVQPQFSRSRARNVKVPPIRVVMAEHAPAPPPRWSSARPAWQIPHARPPTPKSSTVTRFPPPRERPPACVPCRGTLPWPQVATAGGYLGSPAPHETNPEGIVYFDRDRTLPARSPRPFRRILRKPDWEFDERSAWDGNASFTRMVFDEAGSLEGAIDNPFRIELSAGAETLGIHLRWLPRARIEIPFRDCRRATASRSANPATINVPSRLETNLTRASCRTNAAAWAPSRARPSPARVANHPPRHLGRESGVPDASEPRLASPINHTSPTGKWREQRNIEVPPRAKSPSSPRGNET